MDYKSGHENLSQNKQKYTIDEVHFVHIYNGIIFAKDTYFPMIEFKIVPNTMITDKSSPTFKDVNYARGWFVVNTDNDKNELLGPVKLDLSTIETGVRRVSDDRFTQINGLIIECVSNETESLIGTGDIPPWMLNCLQNEADLFDGHN